MLSQAAVNVLPMQHAGGVQVEDAVHFRRLLVVDSYQRRNDRLCARPTSPRVVAVRLVLFLPTAIRAFKRTDVDGALMLAVVCQVALFCMGCI